MSSNENLHKAKTNIILPHNNAPNLTCITAPKALIKYHHLVQPLVTTIMLWDTIILAHVFFAPADGVGGTNAVPMIQAGCTDKHDGQTSRLWSACRKENR